MSNPDSLIGVTCCDCGHIVAFHCRYNEDVYVFVCEMCGNSFFTDLNYEIVNDDRQRDYRCFDVFIDFESAAEALWGVASDSIPDLPNISAHVTRYDEYPIALIVKNNTRLLIMHRHNGEHGGMYVSYEYNELTPYFSVVPGNVFIWSTTMFFFDPHDQPDDKEDEYISRAIRGAIPKDALIVYILEPGYYEKIDEDEPDETEQDDVEQNYAVQDDAVQDEWHILFNDNLTEAQRLARLLLSEAPYESSMISINEIARHIARFTTNKNSIIVDARIVVYNDRKLSKRDTLCFTIENIDTRKVERYYIEICEFSMFTNKLFSYDGTKYPGGENIIKRMRVR